MKRLWALTKDYHQAIHFDEHHFSTPRASTSTPSMQPSSYQSEERRPSDSTGSTEEVPRNTPQRQFPGTEPNMSANPVSMSQEQLDQLVERAIVRALATHQTSQPGQSGLSGSLSSLKQPGQDRLDENR